MNFGWKFCIFIIILAEVHNSVVLLDNNGRRECQLVCSIYEFFTSSNVDGKNLLEKSFENEWMNEVCLSIEREKRKRRVKDTLLEIFSNSGLKEEAKTSLEEIEKKFNERFQFVDGFECLETFYDCLQTSCDGSLERKPIGTSIHLDLEGTTDFAEEAKMVVAKRGYIDAADVCIEYNCRNLTPGSYLYFKCVKKYRCIVGK